MIFGWATTLGGCTVPVIDDFDVAERMAAQERKPLFVFYKSWRSVECGQMQNDLGRPAVQTALFDKIVCILDRDWEPNRRFVAQYGVDRYPAVILIHPDKTYHARPRRLSVEQLVHFLQTAAPPGQRPRLNPQIPRRIAYQWQVQYPVAVRLARDQNRRLFIFYKSVISPESTDVLLNVLNRPDVASYFNDTVNCRLDWAHPPNRRLVALLME